MKRRSKVGGQQGRRRKAMPLKRGNAPKAKRRRSSSARGQETTVARLTSELHEALERQTATGVEKVIVVDPEYVRQQVASIVKDQDLSRYIL